VTNPSGRFVVPIGKATLKDEPPLELCPFPKHALDELRSQVGSETFAAQWQQTPVPPGGSMMAHEISNGWNENNLRNLERFVAGLGGWRLR
jgi:hypothetical protein